MKLQKPIALVLSLLSLTLPVRAQPSPAAKANNDFAVDLYRQLPSKGNLFFSPFSITAALDMVEAGARGDTARELRKGLHLTGKEDVAGLLKRFNAADQPYQLRVADRIWPQVGYEFRPAYIKLLERQFSASIEPQDYRHAAEQARETINHWVEKATEGRIQDLIAPGVLTDLTRLVLTNAVYFKGKWKSGFRARYSANRTFHAQGGPTQAMFMNQTGDFPYVADDHLEVLELPYVGDQLSMVIFLPRQEQGLPELEKSLRFGGLEERMEKLQVTKVQASIPRLKLTQSFNLGGSLRGLGILSAFTPTADFSGMDGKHDLYISAVVHKAFVEVNEEGTEAAAATAVVMTTRAMASGPPPPMFRADHPYLFLIRDRVSGAVLFMGRVASPQ